MSTRRAYKPNALSVLFSLDDKKLDAFDARTDCRMQRGSSSRVASGHPPSDVGRSTGDRQHRGALATASLWC
jgi:hypothetical protein